MPLPHHLVPGEQPPGLGGDQRLQRHQPEAGGTAFRQADEALHLRRQAHKRVEAPSVPLVDEVQRDRKPEVGDERERMRGVDGERRQNRENVLHEVIAQPFELLFRQVRRFGDDDLLLRQFGAQLPPALLLSGDQFIDTFADARELL